MSNLLLAALLGSAVISGAVSGVALAQDSTTKVKPCIGELCPPKSPREDMPKQTEGAKQVEQMQGQDQSSGQVMPRKKKQTSFHSNRHQQSSKQILPRKKKQVSFHRSTRQRPSKKAASRSNFWDWLF